MRRVRSLTPALRVWIFSWTLKHLRAIFCDDSFHVQPVCPLDTVQLESLAGYGRSWARMRAAQRLRPEVVMMLCCLLCCLPPRPVAMPNMGPKLPWAVAVRCAASPHANSLDRGHRQTPQRIRGGHDPSRGDGERPPFVPRGAWLPAEGEVTVEEADEAWEDRQRAREEDTPAGRLSTTGSGTATVVILKRSACRYTASHV